MTIPATGEESIRIQPGECPHCGCFDYETLDQGVDDDYYFYSCKCENCGKLRTEWYRMDYTETTYEPEITEIPAPVEHVVPVNAKEENNKIIEEWLKHLLGVKKNISNKDLNKLTKDLNELKNTRANLIPRSLLVAITVATIPSWTGDEYLSLHCIPLHGVT